MGVIFENFYWMIYNLSLGVIALSSGWLVIKTSVSWIRVVLGAIWLLFIPNTLYIVTDVIHIPRQWNLAGDAVKILLISQYTFFIFFGILLFIVSLYAFEKFLIRIFARRRDILAGLVSVNFVIAFGVAMGRIERTNSWEVFTDLKGVINDAVSVAFSFDAMILVIFFAMLGNIIYFCLKKDFLQSVSSFEEKLSEQ